MQGIIANGPNSRTEWPVCGLWANTLHTAALLCARPWFEAAKCFKSSFDAFESCSRKGRCCLTSTISHCFFPSAAEPFRRREGAAVRLGLGLGLGRRDEQQRGQHARPDAAGRPGHPKSALAREPAATRAQQGWFEMLGTRVKSAL